MKKMVVDEDLSQTTFVVLDLETSGASPKTGSAITEIGAVKVCGGHVLGTFKTFVNPGTSLPPFITELTGITDEMLIDAPRIESVLPLLFEFLGSEKSTVFVAHNAPFDLSFLKASAALLHWAGFDEIKVTGAIRLEVKDVLMEVLRHLNIGVKHRISLGATLTAGAW